MASAAYGGNPSQLRVAQNPMGLRKRVLMRHASLEEQKQQYVTAWQSLSRYMLPWRGQFLGKRRTPPERGGVLNEVIIDMSATLAARTLQSGMLSGITSPTRPWFRLLTPYPDLNEYGPVKVWLGDVERRMYEVFARSNIYKVLPGMYLEMGVFGTSSQQIEPDIESVIRCRQFTIGSFALANGAHLRVDTHYREFSMTSNQLVEQFGQERVSSAVLRDYETGTGETWHRVLHACEPNRGRRMTSSLAKDKAWRSVWMELDSNEHDLLHESGFDKFPFQTPRWMTVGEDVYATSCPGIDSYGDVKSLQLEQKRKLEAIDKQVKPPLVGPKSLEQQRVSLLAGDITYVDTLVGHQGLRPIYDVTANLRDLREDIAECQARIGRAFHEDLFLMLTRSDRRQITAREIVERHEEKLLMLGPVLEGLIDDLLDPTIDRTFDLLVRDPRGLLPEPPAELQGMELAVEYISILAQAQKAVGVSSIERLWGSALSMSERVPSVLDKLDADQTIDELGEMWGVPRRILVDDDIVDGIRRARAEAAQRESEVAQQLDQAKAMQAAGAAARGAQEAPGTFETITGVPAQ